MEKLFVIESSKDEKQYIIGQLIKKSNGEYEYIPTRSAQQSSFTWTRLPFKGNNLPLYIKQRIFSEHNSGIEKFLEKIKLDRYNEWEVLKRTNGKNPRDTLLFVTEEALSKEHQALINDIDEMSNYKVKRISKKKITHTLLYLMVLS